MDGTAGTNQESQRNQGLPIQGKNLAELAYDGSTYMPRRHWRGNYSGCKVVEDEGCNQRKQYAYPPWEQGSNADQVFEHALFFFLAMKLSPVSIPRLCRGILTPLRPCRCFRVQVRKIELQRIRRQPEAHWPKRAVRFHQPGLEQVREQHLRHLVAQAGHLLELGAGFGSIPVAQRYWPQCCANLLNLFPQIHMCKEIQFSLHVMAGMFKKRSFLSCYGAVK